MFRRSYGQKALCSKDPISRRSYVQKVICPEGPILRRFYIQWLLCAKRSHVPRVLVQKGLCSEGPISRTSYVQKVICSECSMFRRFHVQYSSYVQKVLCSVASMFNMSYFQRILAQTKKWNESGFRPPLCTYRLNWARRTSWGWWDDWDDTVLQTQGSKFEPWRSEAEHATSRSRRLPTILTFTRGWGRNIFCFF